MGAQCCSVHALEKTEKTQDGEGYQEAEAMAKLRRQPRSTQVVAGNHLSSFKPRPPVAGGGAGEKHSK